MMSAPNYNYHSPKYYEFDEFRNRNSRWRGIWVVESFESFVDYEIVTHRRYRCSICESVFEGDGLFPTNFCPNCGADMQNEAEVNE